MEASTREISLLVTNFPFEQADLERLRAAIVPGQLVAALGMDGLAETLSAHPAADVLCLMDAPANLLELAPHVRWVAFSSAGVEHVLEHAWTRSPNAPVMTTANGVHGTSISEYVLSAMLLWAKRWPEMLRLQQQRRWPDDPREKLQLQGRELEDATLLIVGLGAIGRRVARLGRAFGMRTLATRHSAASGASDPDVDMLFSMTRLDDALAQADFIVLSVPSTPQTHHLIDAERLAQVKPGALLVNIARGAVVDEAALLAALREGRLGGAVLDVAAREPLPAESPLWTAPNLSISPHISGWSPRYSERLTDLMIDNIARYREGRPLRNQVDVARGY